MALQPNGIQTIKVCAIFLGFATVLVVARVATRLKIRKPLATADYLMFGAWVCFASYCGAVIGVVVNNGGTVNIFVLSPDNAQAVFETGTITELIYLTVLTLVKLSVLFFYLEIFSIHRVRRMIVGLMAVCMAWFVIMIFITAFQCRDPSQTFSLTGYVKEGDRCLEFPKLVFGTELSNAIIDVLILATPFPALAGLHIRTAKKVAVAVVLLLGSGVVVTSICRITFVYDPTGRTTLDWPRSMDWSTVQLGSAIICGCLPTLAPLLPDEWRARMIDRSMKKGQGSDRSDQTMIGVHRHRRMTDSELLQTLDQPSVEPCKMNPEAYSLSVASEAGRSDDAVSLSRAANRIGPDVPTEL